MTNETKKAKAIRKTIELFEQMKDVDLKKFYKDNKELEKSNGYLSSIELKTQLDPKTKDQVNHCYLCTIWFQDNDPCYGCPLEEEGEGCNITDSVWPMIDFGFDDMEQDRYENGCRELLRLVKLYA